jgi:hypothetical protein
MSESPPPEDNLTEEFRSLGKNLADAFRAAWERPERKKLQNDIENGLAEMGSTLKTEFDHVRESPTGQRIRTEVDDLGKRVRSGEMEAKIREELLAALRIVNQELEKVSTRLSPDEPAEHAQGEAPDAPPEDIPAQEG